MGYGAGGCTLVFDVHPDEVEIGRSNDHGFLPLFFFFFLLNL